METVDTVINAGWIITVDDEFSILKQHSIAINDGVIQAIFATNSVQYSAKATFDLPNHVIMPGLVNAHCHAAMSLFRGIADDFPLMTWLEEYIWPAEQRFVNAQFVADGTELAIAEMIRSGTTTFSDMYFFPEVAAKVAEKSGIRAQFAFPIFDMPSNWGANAEDYLQKGLKLIDDFAESELINIAFGPHAPYTIDNGPLNIIKNYALTHGTKIQMHLHETAFEIDSAESEKGERPIRRMANLGLLNDNFQAVHMTQLNDEDIATIAKNNTHIIHCPESNLKLAAGFCPVQQCLNAGINVALGTDGAASNNDLDMFSEMRTAALIGKATSKNTTALNAQTVIQMATINGAKALGIDHKIGSLEIGKTADIIAIDFSELEQQPIYHPASQLIYTNISNNVSYSWVAGNLLMNKRQLTTIDSVECRKKAQYWQQQLMPIANHTTSTCHD
jgi:5-methylthioadenosine/S-adenosylhomocysteine deaminase